MSRPSMPCFLGCRKKDVDARDKRGHDGGEGDSITSGHALGLQQQIARLLDGRARVFRELLM